VDIFDLIREGKVKRFFRSRDKISYPGAICHITQRAPGREILFVEDTDYLSMLRLIKTKSKEFNLKFLSFVLLPNHTHFLLQLIQNNLSKAMKSIFEEYAFYFNKKYHRKGCVFCGRFRQALCFDPTYLLASSIYIHINPVVARLSKTVLEYRWSSILPFIRKFKKETFVDYKFILDLLDENTASARKTYGQLINQALQIKSEHSFDNIRILESFREKLISPLKEIFLPNKPTTILFDIEAKIDALKTQKYKKDPETSAARKYLVEQLTAKGYQLSEIAKKLNLSRTAIYKILK